MRCAKCTTKAVVDSYFTKLEGILEKYHLKDKPEKIINIDETGLTPEHTQRHVLAATNEEVPDIVSPRMARSDTTTIKKKSQPAVQLGSTFHPTLCLKVFERIPN